MFGWLTRLVPAQREMSDDQILTYLQSLGGFEGLIDPAELAFVMQAFRHDGAETTRYFQGMYEARELPQLPAPIYCIVGERDPYTSAYHRRYREWAPFGQLVELEVIPEGNHYFVKHQAAQLARYIATVAANRGVGGVAPPEMPTRTLES